MSWGSELWDKYPELTHHVQNGIDFLENSVASFIRERGKVEAEYAKSLRALVKRYAPKEGAYGSSRAPDEEFTHIKAYKQMLKEVGFQANQHEILADNFCKMQCKSVHESAKRLKEQKKRNVKEAERVGAELKTAYKHMEAARDKFRKAWDEQEKAAAAHQRAAADGAITRNEVQKLQMAANKTSQSCDAAKGKYASQLVKTNDFQQQYYRELLPKVLEGLEDMERERLELFREALMRCVAKEIEVQPIICRCHDSIESALRSVDPAADSLAVVERLKSGDVPPNDFKFEDMSDPQALLAQDPMERPSNLNLYPKKRELERGIDETEKLLQRKQKELVSLQQMVVTYQSNPKFGNSKHFQGEISNLTLEIEDLEKALHAMRANKAAIEDQLESLRSRSPMPPSGSPMLARGSASRGGTTPRSSQSSGSVKSSTLSLGSGGGMHMNTSPDPPIYDSVAGDAHSAGVGRGDSFDQWGDDDDDFTIPPPPPPPPPPNENGSVMTATAMYAYGGPDLQESNIPMVKGEELEVVEGDSDGWTRVRRLAADGFIEEGYVPTSFLDFR